MTVLPPLIEKRCIKCRIVKPASGFRPRKDSKDGLRNDCNECRRARDNARRVEKGDEIRVKDRARYWKNRDANLIKMKAYRAAHIEESRERCRIYRQEHLEHVKSVIRAWYKDHAEEARQWARNYRRTNAKAIGERRRKNYQANKKKILAQVRNWQKAHPELGKARSHRRRARKAGNGGSFTPEQIKKLFELQKGRCWWCHKKLPKKYHIDHRIPLAKGGSSNISNIVLSCPFCNISKGAKLPDEFAGRLL